MDRLLALGRVLVKYSLAGLFAAAVAGLVLSRFTIPLGAPHDVLKPEAELTDELVDKLRERVGQAKVEGVEQAIELSLAITAPLLKYETSRLTLLVFHDEVRPGNSEEYAHLLAGVLGEVLRQTRQKAQLAVVRSTTVRVLGQRYPFPVGSGHHWVFVEQWREGIGHRWYVDPTLHDLTGRWRIIDQVQEPVPITAVPRGKKTR